eukprot:scaffold3576_cov170-Amphora_coffeaeformis.AAC.13
MGWQRTLLLSSEERAPDVTLHCFYPGWMIGFGSRKAVEKAKSFCDQIIPSDKRTKMTDDSRLLAQATCLGVGGNKSR